MAIIDTPTPPPATPIWNTVLRYGGFTALALVLFSVILYLIDFDIMSISSLIILYPVIFGITIAMAIIAVKYQRDKLDGGYITFGKALGVGFLTVFIGSFLSGFWNYILINFIDTDYLNKIKDQFEASWGERMQADQLEQAMARFDEMGSISAAISNGLIGGIVIGLIAGLIAAAVMKKQAPYMRA